MPRISWELIVLSPAPVFARHPNDPVVTAANVICQCAVERTTTESGRLEERLLPPGKKIRLGYGSSDSGEMPVRQLRQYQIILR